MIKHAVVKQTLFDHLEIARTFTSRMVGLLNRKSLNPQSALLLTNCCAVHTCGMRFPIDVAFLDKDGFVLSIVERMGTFRSASNREATHTLECRAGRMSELGIVTGNQLAWDQIQGVARLEYSDTHNS